MRATKRKSLDVIVDHDSIFALTAVQLQHFWDGERSYEVAENEIINSVLGSNINDDWLQKYLPAMKSYAIRLFSSSPDKKGESAAIEMMLEKVGTLSSPGLDSETLVNSFLLCLLKLSMNFTNKFRKVFIRVLCVRKIFPTYKLLTLGKGFISVLIDWISEISRSYPISQWSWALLQIFSNLMNTEDISKNIPYITSLIDLSVVNESLAPVIIWKELWATIMLKPRITDKKMVKYIQ